MNDDDERIHRARSRTRTWTPRTSPILAPARGQTAPPPRPASARAGLTFISQPTLGSLVPIDGHDPAALHDEQRRRRREAHAQASPTERLLEAYRAFCLWRGTPEGIEEFDPLHEITDVMDELAEGLEMQGVPYVIGGAFALAIHGTPRFTYNLDVMILADLGRARSALSDPRWEEMSPVSFREATTDLLIDLHPVRDEAQRWAAEQAETVELLDREIQVLTPEGLAVMLLREATEGEADVRPLRLRDVELLARQPGLDWDEVARQAERFGYEEAHGDVDGPGKPEL